MLKHSSFNIFTSNDLYYHIIYQLLKTGPGFTEKAIIYERNIIICIDFAFNIAIQLEIQQFKKDYKLITDSEPRAQV